MLCRWFLGEKDSLHNMHWMHGKEKKKEKNMKKICQFIGAGILCVGLCLIPSMAVFAGNINAEEQRLLDAAGQQYLYDGVMYKATDSAIATARNYLLQDDVDLTKEQVDSALSQVMNLMPDAIAGGYMVAVEKPKPADPVTPVEPIPTETEAPTEETETETETEIEETVEKPVQKPDKEEPAETETEETTTEEIEESTEEAIAVVEVPDESLESTEASQETSEEESTARKVLRNKKFVDNANLMTVSLSVIIVAVIVAVIVLFQHKNGSRSGKSHHKKRKK